MAKPAKKEEKKPAKAKAPEEAPMHGHVSEKYDSSKIGFGSLCGSVDVFDVCLKKAKYKGKFEFTYVSLSQVIVKRIDTG